MKSVAVRCPNCGASLEQKSKFCSQCGSPVMIEEDVQKLQYTYQQVDDARIREADVHETVRMKEIELELFKLQDAARARNRNLFVRFGVILVFVLVFAALLVAAASNKLMEGTYSLFAFCMIIVIFISVLVLFRNKK